MRKRGFRGFRRSGGARRFRKRRGVWLPLLGSDWTAGEGAEHYNDASITFESAPVGNRRADGVESEVFPVVPDFTWTVHNDGTSRAASLHERTSGNCWKLDRIVGRCAITCWESDADIPAEDQWPYIQVGAGFFVARSEEGQDSVPDLFSDEYDVLAADNIRNPWIWRKTWILTNPAGSRIFRDDFPIATTQCSSPYQSADVDVKSKRMIRPEHRLWFTYSVIGWNGTTEEIADVGAQPRALGNVDIRCFGTIVNNPRGGGSF